MELPTVEWSITLKIRLWFHSKPHQLILDCSKASNNPLAQSQCKLFKQSNWKKKKINLPICLRVPFPFYTPEKPLARFYIIILIITGSFIIQACFGCHINYQIAINWEKIALKSIYHFSKHFMMLSALQLYSLKSITGITCYFMSQIYANIQVDCVLYFYGFFFILTSKIYLGICKSKHHF